MVIVSSFIAYYYNMIIAWAIFYFFASFTSTLPWEDCNDPDYNTECKWSNNMEKLVLCDQTRWGVELKKSR